MNFTSGILVSKSPQLNIPSIKTIEKNGGKFDKKIDVGVGRPQNDITGMNYNPEF